jgi:hypothetical protein
MQQIQSGVNPSRVVIRENGQTLEDAFVSGITWDVVLEFADMNACVIYRDGDTLHVLVVSRTPSAWGNA